MTRMSGLACTVICNLIDTHYSVAAHQREVHSEGGSHLLDKLDTASAASVGAFTPTSVST